MCPTQAVRSFHNFAVAELRLCISRSCDIVYGVRLVHDAHPFITIFFGPRGSQMAEAAPLKSHQI